MKWRRDFETSLTRYNIKCFEWRRREHKRVKITVDCDANRMEILIFAEVGYLGNTNELITISAEQN